MSSHNEAIFQDAFNFLCVGEPLGRGVHRTVWACRFRDDLVVKVEENGDAAHRSFANVREFDFYNYWRDHKPVADWLAPCEYLSPDGRLMLQRRVDPLPRDYALPAKLPAFLTDHKQSNFGLLDGRLVCVDYATTIQPATWRCARHTSTPKET
jgi:hypothetical protein